MLQEIVLNNKYNCCIRSITCRNNYWSTTTGGSTYRAVYQGLYQLLIKHNIFTVRATDAQGQTTDQALQLPQAGIIILEDSVNGITLKKHQLLQVERLGLFLFGVNGYITKYYMLGSRVTEVICLTIAQIQVGLQWATDKCFSNI